MTTRKGNESIVQKENCFVEEIKEVELTSRRGKLIYDRTYNPVGLNKVSHFSRRDRGFCMEGILKNTPSSSKIHCYVKNRNGLYLNRYRSNSKSVRVLLRVSAKLVRKQGKVHLSS